MKNVNVVFLTEGGRNIGLGHLSRSIAIVQAFEREGIKPEMIVNADETVRHFLKGTKYRIYNWLKNSKAILKDLEDIEVCVVDSYLAPASFYNALSKKVLVPVYVDDYKRLSYPRGVILNGNIYGDQLRYKQAFGFKNLLGRRYVYLRKIFWKTEPIQIKKDVKQIFVTLGGHDILGLTAPVLASITKQFPDIGKTVIIGQGFKNINQIRQAVDRKTRLVVQPSGEKMKSLMLRSDLAISAGGQTIAELARLGIPTIGLMTADNQKFNLQYWNKHKAIKLAGTYLKPKDILMKLGQEITNLQPRKARAALSLRARQLVDGQGPQRIVQAILKAI